MSEEYSVLSKQHRERVEALQVASSLLRSTTIGSSKPADWPDMVSVAQYILSGVAGVLELRVFSENMPTGELVVPDLWGPPAPPEE